MVTLGGLAVVFAAGLLVLVLRSTDNGTDSSATSSSATTAATSTSSPSTVPVSTATTVPPTPPPTSAPPVASVPVRGVVSRTCGARGTGDCFLSVRSSPDAESPELYRLSEDDEVWITCTSSGDSVLSSMLGRRTSIWVRTDQGGWVSLAFVDAPGFDPFTDSHPC